jgi:hypothetical protein
MRTPRVVTTAARKENEPNCHGFPHLQVESRMRAPMPNGGEQSGQEKRAEESEEDSTNQDAVLQRNALEI